MLRCYVELLRQISLLRNATSIHINLYFILVSRVEFFYYYFSWFSLIFSFNYLIQSSPLCSRFTDLSYFSSCSVPADNSMVLIGYLTINSVFIYLQIRFFVCYNKQIKSYTFFSYNKSILQTRHSFSIIIISR